MEFGKFVWFSMYFMKMRFCAKLWAKREKWVFHVFLQRKQVRGENGLIYKVLLQMKGLNGLDNF